MIALLQRVSMAEVWIEGKRFSRIDKGLLVFLGIDKNDPQNQSIQTEIESLADKVLAYRIFADEKDQMNLNVMQASGELLIVSQFTLVADTDKGLRPSFSKAAHPKEALLLYDSFILYLNKKYPKIKTGIFGAKMEVGLVNDGPATFVLNSLSA